MVVDMRKLIFAVLLPVIVTIFMSGCAQLQPVALDTAQYALNKYGSTLAAGTLAESGSYEMVVAPYYTDLDLRAKRAVMAVRSGAITKETGSKILSLLERARSHVDLAWAEKQETLTAKSELLEAKKLQDRIDALLRGDPDPALPINLLEQFIPRV